MRSIYYDKNKLILNDVFLSLRLGFVTTSVTASNLLLQTFLFH